jgi:hypothetical protein
MDCHEMGLGDRVVDYFDALSSRAISRQAIMRLSENYLELLSEMHPW